MHVCVGTCIHKHNEKSYICIVEEYYKLKKQKGDQVSIKRQNRWSRVDYVLLLYFFYFFQRDT